MNSRNQSSTTIVSVASVVIVIVIMLISSGAAYFSGSSSPAAEETRRLDALLASVKDKSVADAVPVLQRAYPGYQVKQNMGGKNKKGTNTVWYSLAENGRIHSIGVNGNGAALPDLSV